MIQNINLSLLKRLALLSMLLLTMATLNNAMAVDMPHAGTDRVSFESVTSIDCPTCDTGTSIDAPCASEDGNAHEHHQHTQHQCQSSSLFLAYSASVTTKSAISVQYSDYTDFFSLNPTAPHTRPPIALS